jgi:2-(1,2-epoxy-1,2-dihydrophenyl)acetyl-CoA isomerase
MNEMSEQQSVGVMKELAGPIAHLVLNRPEQRNAMDTQSLEILLRHLREIEHDPAIRCVILRGAGKHFMAGADMKAFKESIDHSKVALRGLFEDHVLRDGNRFPQLMERMPQPIIASVRGGVIGGGLAMALSADMIIASDTAFFSASQVNLGLVPDGGVTWNLTRLVGPRHAKKLMFLGEPMSAEEAERIGLINQVVPDADLESATLELANKLAAKPRTSLSSIKQLVNDAARMTIAEALQREAKLVGDCVSHKDFNEGLAAFLEKRKPDFG